MKPYSGHIFSLRLLFLTFTLIWIFPEIQAQNDCSISQSASGKLYSSKSDLPIDCYRPRISETNLVYDSQSSIAESETHSISLKQVVLFVGNSWFMAFDKKDSLCSRNSIFSETDGEYNFIALMKNNEVIRKFVPDKYLVRGQSSKYSAFENSFKQGSAELINGEDIVFFTSQISRQDPMVTIHVAPGELANYKNRIIEILSESASTVPIIQSDDLNRLDSDSAENNPSSQGIAESRIEKPIDNPKDIASIDEKIEENEISEKEINLEEKVSKKEEKLGAREQKRLSKEAASTEKAESLNQEGELAERNKEDSPASESIKTELTPKEQEEEVVENPVELVELEHKPVQQAPIVAKETVTEIPKDRQMTLAEPLEEDKASATNLGARDIPESTNVIDESDMEEISRMAAFQIEQLGSSFKTMVDRSIPSHIKRQKRENTVETLFVNDKAEVSVSSVTSAELSYYFIKEYLERLETMYYQRVEIDFSDIHKVTDLKKNPDGTWSGTVTFSQIFKGFTNANDLNPVYGDITHKNVTIVVKRVETYTGGTRPDISWIVLLGDIGVNQTQRI